MSRCLVLHQTVPPDAPPDERDVLDAASAVALALRGQGWHVTTAPVGPDLAALSALLHAHPADLVFNLVESLAGSDALAVAVPALLADLGIAFTGSDAAAVALAGDKRATRRALRAAGLPVPPDAADGWAGPFIAKPISRHASAGLGPHCVTQGKPPPRPGWFAEAYVEGREFAVALLDDGAGPPLVLPIAEMHFLDWPADTPRVLGYAAKWCPGSPEDRRTARGFDGIDAELSARLAAIARGCWAALGLAGYARIDLRVTAAGVAYVIDVNANPCLSPDAGFAAAARAGLDHAALVARIAHAALPPPPALAARPSRAPRAASLREALEPGDTIGALCRATGFFSEAEIAIAEELAADRREKGAASDYRFLLADDAEGLAGFACYGAVPATREAWDLYWIVVHPRAQGGGLGRGLVAAVLDAVRGAGGGRLYAETSARPQYAPTRAFYAAAGFTLDAVLPDFYAPGEAKQVWLRVARSD